jgi:hypothetical protein
MNSQDKIKSLNIVFENFINPSLQIKLIALKKLQRFVRRGSGAHAHHNMVCKVYPFGSPIGPPVLYRQVCGCLEGHCEKIPIRIYKKYKRIQYAIKKLYGDKDGKINFDSCVETTYNGLPIHSFEQFKNVQIINKYYTSMEHCYCNNKPFHSYEWMISHPRGNFTAKDGLRYIMCELSGDELTYYTRFKLSNYLANRLS